MKRGFIGFDLEVATSLQDFTKWKNYRPLGITCAAVHFDKYSTQYWYSKNDTDDFKPKMSKHDAQRLVEVLLAAVNRGWSIVTWNGLGFDFDVLAEESGMWEECRNLALNHIDMMFHLFCIKGYPLGLETAAKGMGLQGKLDGVSGDRAPELWAQGDYQTVLNYVKQDTITTLEVAKAVLRRGYLSWISNSGRRQKVMFPNGWLTVSEARKIQEPDTEWMTDPLKRKEFYSWTLNKTCKSKSHKDKQNEIAGVQNGLHSDQIYHIQWDHPDTIFTAKDKLTSVNNENRFPETEFVIHSEINLSRSFERSLDPRNDHYPKDGHRRKREEKYEKGYIPERVENWHADCELNWEHEVEIYDGKEEYGENMARSNRDGWFYSDEDDSSDPYII